ncbi:hypothetical protein H1230_12575 [Paenibacillus sp. 19GGS1-52]|uniref:hypothetical protein n=1 Tax=Paenibacillus sp. 19GGS1-52 TaxID=2758563 RepID=UPI001EFA4183|nr:hypothetical protein [Paenibacillus sp. 19GGS1-52]ULO09529.1 hypothetical protein H1230_12575 [Paenibacillus sp. 19GGS1-52]
MQKGILEDIKVSTEAIANVFGGKSASPFLIFVQSDQGQQNYAENPTGQTYYYSWGNYIVYGPKGRNTAVISHELVHAELRERLLNKDRVPAWFDEGLATMVDGRYSDNQSVWARETDNGKQNINFDKMNSHAAFAYGTAEAETNYNLACYEVTRWYSIVGQDGIMKFISELNSGKDFNSVYSSIEADS